jgi:hypothetical protein
MIVILFFIYTVLLAVLIIYNISIYRRTGRLATLLLVLNAAGLIWENGVIAGGSFVGQGSLLQVLNMGRYCLHFTFVPLMAWPLLEQLRVAGHGWAGSKYARLALGVFILGLIGLGFGAGAPGLFDRLEAVSLGGTLRYNAPNAASAVIAIAIMSAALASGFVLWVKNGWPWLFLAALLTFIVEGGLLNFELLGMVAGNASEVIFQLALLQTELYVSGKR